MKKLQTKLIYKHCMIKYEVKELFCMIETSPNMEKGYKEG